MQYRLKNTEKGLNYEKNVFTRKNKRFERSVWLAERIKNMGRSSMHWMENNTNNLTGGISMYWAHDDIYEDNSGNLFTGEYICRTGYLSGHNILDDPAAKLLNHIYIWHENRGNDYVREVHINNNVKYDYRSTRKITCNYDQLFRESDNMILCNDIEKYVDLSYVENGNLYYEEDGETYQYDIYQFFIIDDQLADALSRHTNEIIMYSEDLDVYVLGVTHFGTSWGYVPSQWIINKEENK